MLIPTIDEKKQQIKRLKNQKSPAKEEIQRDILK